MGLARCGKDKSVYSQYGVAYCGYISGGVMQEIIRARVDAALKDKFEAIAKSRGKSSSLLLREFMVEFVSSHEEQERRRAETLLAIESIEAGRFVDGDEVFAWMDSWGTGAETDMPECK
jgi:predicted transcriptional regulator